MSSPVAELEAGLQAMLSLKPPGVTGSRIQSITALCKANVQSESVLIQKLFTHFKKAPGTHKLGVLYVVDSVTREWMVQAKAAAQPINSSALDGSYAAGVNRVKELLPVLMNDIIQSAPDNQKEKIKKLVDIWEKGQTFPLQMLTSFKEKLSASMQNRSTTPDGSPPPDLQIRLGLQQPKAPTPPTPAVAAPNTASILEALANLARQNGSAGPNVPNAQTQNSSVNVSNAQNNPAQQAAVLNQSVPFPPFPQPVNVPAPAATFASQGPSDGAHFAGSNQTNPFPGIPPPSGGVVDSGTAMLVKMLADRGMNAEQIAGIIAAGSQGALSAPPPPSFPSQYAQPPLSEQNGYNGIDGRGVRSEESRDRNGFHESFRSTPPYRRRSRSPSPVRAWNAQNSQNSPASRRRDDPNFDYGRTRGSPNRSRDEGGRGGRARGNNEYRQRSPQRRRGRSPSPPRSRDGYGAGPKWIDYDPTIPKGSIKVLSRTLFVGGVNSSEQDLRSVFDRYGKVQTCIVNKDKRHAFVKMICRKDAVNAKEAMGDNRDKDPQSKIRQFNQTRWGVGFGPRDCSDYQTGISVIPISKLTDADRKWMITAEYGGTGGKPIESGMVVEEPDIEIGQGVSSKAISRRMQTDRGGNSGSKSGRDRDDDEGSRFRRSMDRDDRRDNDRRDQNTTNGSSTAVPSFTMPGGMPAFSNMPGMPNFPMPTLPNGMPMFPLPPGFTFPGMPSAPGQSGQNGQNYQQPPPPGRN